MKLELPINVLNILNSLNEAGYDAYVVGGAVRSLLLGEKPKDYDICTNALPDTIEKLFENTIPTGKKYGTITIVLLNEDNSAYEFYEVTTFRYDSPLTDGRRPDYVRFGETLLDDVDRRDFTINSIAYNPSTGLIDYKNGMKDIQDKIIRCVGDPTTRFKEDGLRILRAIRFAVRYKFLIHPDTLNAMIELTVKNKSINVLNSISKERIHDEITNILSYDFSFLPDNDFNKIISILKYILDIEGEKNILTKDMLDGYFYIKKLIDFYKDASIELVKNKLQYYKFSNNEIKIIINNIKAYQYLNKNRYTNFKYNLKMCWYMWGITSTFYSIYMMNLNKKEHNLLIQSLKEPSSLSELALNGNDIKENFDIKDKEIGTYLELALFHIFDYPEDNKKDILIKYLKTL